MRRLEPVNIAAAMLMLVIGVLICSPVLDPARLTVANQVGRLHRGAVSPESFDYLALRFHDGRFGREALQELARSSNPKIVAGVRAALNASNPNDTSDARKLQPAFSGVHVYPAGAQAPESLLRQQWPAETAPDCFIGSAACDLIVRDVTGDGRPEVLVDDDPETSPIERTIKVFEEANGVWRRIGYFQHACALQVQDFGLPAARLIAPSGKDLVVKGARIPFVSTAECPAATAKPASATSHKALASDGG